MSVSTHRRYVAQCRYARKIPILYSYIANNTVSAVDGVCSSASFDSKSDVKGNSLIVAIKIK